METEPSMCCNPQYPPPFLSMNLYVIPIVAIQEFSIVLKELSPYSLGDLLFASLRKLRPSSMNLLWNSSNGINKSLHYLVWLTSPVWFLLNLTLKLPITVLYGKKSAGECHRKYRNIYWSVSWTQALRGSLQPHLSLEHGFYLPFSLKDCSKDIALRYWCGIENTCTVYVTEPS